MLLHAVHRVGALFVGGGGGGGGREVVSLVSLQYETNSRFAGTHMVSMEVGDEDFVQLAWPEAAPHQLHLATLPTVKHPAAQLYRD